MAVPERNKQRIKKKPTAKFSCLIRMKSIIHSAIDSIAPLFEIYKRFCQETTLHGLKHTVADNLHWFERVLWFILTMSAFFGAVYCGLSQLARYNSEPVVVSLQRDYRSWWTTFPAVTACFMDRVDPSRARDAIEYFWNVTEETEPAKYRYYYIFIGLVTDVSFRINLQNFWKYQFDDTLKGVDLLQLVVSVHPTYPLNVIVDGKLRVIQWVPVMTEMGMCMTFNSLYSRYQYLLDDFSWKAEKMHKCHYHSGQCFVRIESSNNAVRFFIHSPYDIPTAISNPTGELSPGEELILDFKTVEIQAAPGVKLLSPAQRRCRYPDEWLSNSIKAYSFGLCQMHCRNRMSAMFCGCRPFFHVNGASLGGTTALFVGASVLTVVETALFFLRYTVELLIGAFTRRGKKAVAPFNR